MMIALVVDVPESMPAKYPSFRVATSELSKQVTNGLDVSEVAVVPH
jgi:hypothetical protein